MMRAHSLRWSIVAGLALGAAAAAWALPGGAPRVARSGRIIDTYVPMDHYRERHSVRIRATPEQVDRAARRVTAREVRLLRPLLHARALGFPIDLEERHMGRPVLELARGNSVLVLGDRPRREIVLGTIGQFWRDRAVHVRTAEEFRRYRRAGYAKAAVNLIIEPEPGGWTRLTSETRIACTDAAAVREFGSYWRFVNPSTSILRREWLGAIKRRAERRS